MSQPKQRRSEETVAAIIASAREQFGREGFSAVGLDSVAASCGRTKGAVYYHFATKEALFDEVFRREQRRLADDVVTAGRSSDPVDSFADGVGHYLSIIAADPVAARITLLDAPSVLGWIQWRTCDGGPFRQLCRVAVGQMAQAGRLRSDQDPELLADIILGAITEGALVVATSADPPTAAREVTASCTTLIAGITSS